jgi:uncharacterized membrane protein YcaP (DUF421 family)
MNLIFYYSNAAFRSLVALGVLFVLTRFAGKKHISHLTLFDYVTGISIGAITGAFAVNENVRYSDAIISLVIFGLFPIIASYITLKSIKGRKILTGLPTVLIQNGKIMENNLRKSRFAISDVLEELRVKGAFNVSDVEFAILETNGQVSLQLKSQKQPLTPSDLGIPTKYLGLSAILILDGNIMYNNLKNISLDEMWLLSELKKRKIDSPEEVLLASLDTNGYLHIDRKNKNINPLEVME